MNDDAFLIQAGAQQTLAFDMKRRDGSDEIGFSAFQSATFALAEKADMTIPISGLTMGAGSFVSPNSIEIPQTAAAAVVPGLYFGQLTVTFDSKVYKSTVFAVRVTP